jgi:two-component system alkaline phosphatase synthesis response regulator PhoP
MAGQRILVADDEPYMVRSLSFVLKREGYEVESASDGEEALIKFEEFDPDVVFLDLMMPKKNGYEVCSDIKNNERFKGRKPYVIILTCKGQDSDRYKGFLQGADEYITKPFSPVEIAERVKRYFSEKGGPGKTDE